MSRQTLRPLRRVLANWTFSTILLQDSVPDRLRGRIFAIGLAALPGVVWTALLGGMQRREAAGAG